MLLKVLLIAASLGLDNFAVSIAIGIAGVSGGLRLRIALVFGLFEAGMPLLGLLVGRGLAHTLGGSAHLIGGGLLIATGIHAGYSTVSGDDGDEGDEARAAVADPRLARLLLLGLGLSIDNLIVGFALGADHVPLAPSIVAITVASVGLSLLGLELGARLGRRVERRGELVGGAVLVLVGLAIVTNLL